MEALGRLFDIAAGVTPRDLEAAASTGNRVRLRDADGVTVVIFKGAAAAGGDPTYTLREHNAGSAGVSQNLPVIDKFWHKTEATLDADETWTKVTQAAAATITGDFNASEQIIVFEVEAEALSAGFGWISVDVTDPAGTGPQNGAVLYLLRDLKVMRAPEALAATQ
jgi:hypothetical protein